MSIKKWIIGLAITTILFVFGLFVYPGLYQYDKLDQRYPVKINRITGQTQVLTPKGWIKMEEFQATSPQSQVATSNLEKMKGSVKISSDDITADFFNNTDNIVRKVTIQVTWYKEDGGPDSQVFSLDLVQGSGAPGQSSVYRKNLGFAKFANINQKRWEWSFINAE